MLTVETIRKIRLSVHRDGKSIRQTAKDLYQLNISSKGVKRFGSLRWTLSEIKR